MDSVTMWIRKLKESGREQAADVLWNRYLQQLLQVAWQKLGPASRTVADEEDVAITAFAALLEGICQERFSQLGDRHDLWQVLIMLTERKALNQARQQRAKKRGGTQRAENLPSEVAAPEPSPQLAAELAEEFELRLRELPDEFERQVAIRRLQGYSNTEIAAALDVGVRTVERKLALIRRTWQTHVDPPSR